MSNGPYQPGGTNGLRLGTFTGATLGEGRGDSGFGVAGVFESIFVSLDVTVSRIVGFMAGDSGITPVGSDVSELRQATDKRVRATSIKAASRDKRNFIVSCLVSVARLIDGVKVALVLGQR